MKNIGQNIKFHLRCIRAAVRAIAVLCAFLLLAAPAMAEWELVQAHADWSPRAFHLLHEYRYTEYPDTIASNGELWVVGGCSESPGTPYPLGKWFVEFASGSQWTFLPHEMAPGSVGLPSCKAAFAAIPGNTEVVFALGGGDCFEPGCAASNDRFGSSTLDEARWTTWFVAPNWSPRIGHGIIVRDDKVLIVGGLFPGSALEAPAAQARYYFNEVWWENLSLAEGEEQYDTPYLAPWAGRYGHSCVAVGDTLVLAGGFVEDAGPLGEKAVKDVWTSTDEGVNWSLATADAPWSARGFHGCAVVDGRVWIVGGSDGAGSDFADTWFSDDLGVTWQQYRAQAPWTARHGHAIADIQGTLWLTGGRTSQGAYFNDVWRLNTEPVPIHTADQDGNGRVSLSELLRVVQFYSFGAFHCEDGTEDNYAPNVGDQSCAYYAADYNPADWRIDLSELLRLIQLYSAGGYVLCETGEDGFCMAK